ncbi:MAG: hypothetical protein LBB39_02530 [Mycoplasmataceae bacterium]|jgi:DNA polymerase/3'-5' exonuclease PolX|nr:hypothetical protein [Mycoplasmataceae bacterium]
MEKLHFKENIVNNVVLQRLNKIPGVNKKKEIKISFSVSAISISVSPIPYILNVYEIAKRIQNLIKEEIISKFNKHIIINVSLIS